LNDNDVKVHPKLEISSIFKCTVENEDFLGTLPAGKGHQKYILRTFC